MSLVLWLRGGFQPAAPLVHRRSRSAAYAAAIAIGAAVLILRQSGVSALDSVWAEDGTVFLAGALSRQLPDLLLAPYAGYAHLAPRLLAEVASHVPLEFAAAALSGGSAFVVAALAVFVYHTSAGVEHRSLRLVTAGSMVLLPIVAKEGLDSAANLHWFLTVACFWALLSVPTRASDRALAAGVTLLGALSDPLVALLAPVVAARLLALRDWRAHWVTLSWAVGLGIQGLVVLANGSSETPCVGSGGLGLLDVARAYATRVVTINLVGLPAVESLWSLLGTLFPLLCLALVLGLAFYAGSRLRSAVSPVVLLAVLSSVLLLVVSYRVRWCQIDAVGSTMGGLSGARYGIAPALLFISAVAVVIDRWASSAGRWGRRIFIGLFAFAAITSFVAPNAREAGPSWEAALRDARAVCSQQGNIGVASLPISPPGWSMSTSCATIAGSP